MAVEQQVFRIRDLTVRYGDREVLAVPWLEIAGGKIYGIIGPSGAGKSTFLRVLNLLEKPTRGEIQFAGEPFVYHGPRRLAMQRQMAMVFQKPVLFSGTVLDNILYGLRIRGIKGKEASQKALAVLAMVGMEGFAQAPAKTLSGGEGQRISLARAIVLEPRVLLLDEPTANLDPANVLIMEKIIARVHRELETTVILVTHNLFQAKRLAQETLFFHQGRLVEHNLTAALFEKPQHLATRAFLQGEMVY